MRPILHLTHIDNLANVVEAEGLWSNNHMPPRLIPRSSAHAKVQERRARIRVPCGPGGVLHDYVPFYFGARSPMLYAIASGFVAGASRDQQAMIYLVSSVEAVLMAELRWVFTDGHAVIALTEFFDQQSDLRHIDWSTIHARYWAQTPQDPDRKRRKQAEFLVHRFFPFKCLHEISVCSHAAKQRVLRLLTNSHPRIGVRVRRDWYYEEESRR